MFDDKVIRMNQSYVLVFVLVAFLVWSPVKSKKMLRDGKTLKWFNCDVEDEKEPSVLMNGFQITPHPFILASGTNIRVNGSLEVKQNFTSNDTFTVNLEIEKKIDLWFLKSYWVLLPCGKSCERSKLKCEDILKENCPLTSGLADLDIDIALPEIPELLKKVLNAGEYRVTAMVFHEQTDDLVFCFQVQQDNTN